MTSHRIVRVPTKFNPETCSHFVKELNDAENDPECRVIIFEGTQDYFCLGMDLEYLTTQDHNEFLSDIQKLFMLIRVCTTPIIAKIMGDVIAGGVGIVALADIVITNRDATFCLPEARFGIAPSMVMTCLSSRVSTQDIRMMVLTSNSLDANEAERIGIVDAISDSENLNDTVMYWVKRLANICPSTIRETKHQLNALGPDFEKSLKFGCKAVQDQLNGSEKMISITRYLEDIRFFNEEYANG